MENSDTRQMLGMEELNNSPEALQAAIQPNIKQLPTRTHEEDATSKPFLEHWESLPGMCILGFASPYLILAGFLLACFSCAQNETLVAISVIAYLIYSAVQYFGSFVYALWIYPSLFTDKPIMHSNRLVSFSNYFFGRMIFGLCWESALTTRCKGNSHFVFVVLLAVLIVLPAVARSLSAFDPITTTPTSPTSSNTSTTNITLDIIGYYDPDGDNWLDATGTATISDTTISFTADVEGKKRSLAGTLTFTDDDGSKYFESSLDSCIIFGEYEGAQYILVYYDDSFEDMCYGLAVE